MLTANLAGGESHKSDSRILKHKQAESCGDFISNRHRNNCFGVMNRTMQVRQVLYGGDQRTQVEIKNTTRTGIQ